ncbi:BPL-N domain-containing protein [Paludibacterium sp. B53371]|uniref:BPL-N domain-containing protein n=1 Tax=Paludibacterium sp. B53371 TaxID=2806263 RepID=UPI001C03EAFA|nr:BPL-N domain-containing protein [Paludibacterium sp. B53371]
MKKWLVSGLWCLSAAVSAQTVGIFNGPGTCDGCAETIGALFTQRGDKVVYLDQRTLSAATLANLQVYVQPGGSDDIDETLDVLSPRQVAALRDFVRGGKRYLGVCAGAYLAARYSDAASRKPAFGLIALDELHPETRYAHASLLKVRWGGQSRWMYNQSGAHFGKQAPAGARVLGRYEQTGRIAALETRFGQGKVVLIGPHLEADQSWYRLEGLSLRHGLNQDLFRQVIDQL